MGAVLAFTAHVEIFNCYKCGGPIALTATQEKALRKNREDFFCPLGHAQVFTGESEADKLRRELEAEKVKSARELAWRKQAEESAATARKAEAIVRGKLKATKERVGNGVCPCCNRSFTNLQRHMGTKHPAYKAEAAT